MHVPSETIPTNLIIALEKLHRRACKIEAYSPLTNISEQLIFILIIIIRIIMSY